ncbi:MAG TPA: hypothetical protein VJ124_15385 [Pyrinomonadaceae bacterium]|nr:hypothetical protein [Pyrinomonadaceae bacterium]
MKIDGLFDEHNSLAIDAVTTDPRPVDSRLGGTQPWERVSTSEALLTTSAKSERAGERRQAPPDVVVLSHLRWDFVYQRPQHLLTRAARERRVFFVERCCRNQQINKKLTILGWGFLGSSMKGSMANCLNLSPEPVRSGSLFWLAQW